MDLSERFAQDLSFVLTVLTHCALLFCLLYVLSHLRKVAAWLGFVKTIDNVHRLDSFIQWIRIKCCCCFSSSSKRSRKKIK